MPKTMSLRLNDEQAATLELIARADDQSVTEAIRVAIDAHIKARRADKAFVARLAERRAAEAALYGRLAK
jgi:predicted transcriptional regulator